MGPYLMRVVAACRPYRTAMLYRLVQHVYFTRESNPSYRAAFSDATTQDILLHNAFAARPPTMLAKGKAAVASPLSAIDMDEIALVDFLRQKPSPSLHDLHLLGPYLFLLSNAVRQQVARDLDEIPKDDAACKLARQWRGDAMGPTITHGAQVLDVWSHRVCQQRTQTTGGYGPEWLSHVVSSLRATPPGLESCLRLIPNTALMPM